MNNFSTLFQFGCDLFGYEKASKMNNDYINIFFNDWKDNYSSLTIVQYKNLLKTRGWFD